MKQIISELKGKKIVLFKQIEGNAWRKEAT